MVIPAALPFSTNMEFSTSFIFFLLANLNTSSTSLLYEISLVSIFSTDLTQKQKEKNKFLETQGVASWQMYSLIESKKNLPTDL